MTTQSKTHHYVPQLLLRGFARTDRVATLDLVTRDLKVQSVANAAAENHFNTIRLADGNKSDIAERLIADKVETPAAPIVGRIREGGWVQNDRERLKLARLVALQAVRTPHHREAADALAEHMMKLEIAAGGPTALRSALEAQAAEPVEDAEVAAAWESVRDFDWSMSLPREVHVRDMLEAADEFTPGIAELYDFSVIRWGRKHLLTCDSPVVLIRDQGAPAWEGVGLYTAGTIYLPLGRQVALQLLHRGRDLHTEGATFPGTAKGARTLNGAIVQAAWRRIYYDPEDQLADLVGSDFELPTPTRQSFDTRHSTELRNRLLSMAEWHTAHPDQPHPMSRFPAEGVEPWSYEPPDE